MHRSYRLKRGGKFSRLTIIASEYGAAGYSEVRCACGARGRAKNNHLVSGNARQCHKCKLRQIGKSNAGKSKTRRIFPRDALRQRLRVVRAGMIGRCHAAEHQDYHNYGARGITVCDRWRNSFEDFLADIKRIPKHDDPALRIDRRDNNQGYHPDNVCFVTHSTNMRNRRITTFIDFQGVDIPLAQFHEENCPEWTRKNVFYHHHNGCTAAQILELYAKRGQTKQAKTRILKSFTGRE